MCDYVDESVQLRNRACATPAALFVSNHADESLQLRGYACDYANECVQLPQPCTLQLCRRECATFVVVRELLSDESVQPLSPCVSYYTN